MIFIVSIIERLLGDQVKFEYYRPLARAGAVACSHASAAASMWHSTTVAFVVMSFRLCYDVIISAVALLCCDAGLLCYIAR